MNAEKRIKLHTLGYPRMGDQRELKRTLEAYWRGKRSINQLLETGKELRQRNWLKQKRAGIDWIPSNDFSFYDHMLDTSAMVGNVPRRFTWQGDDVDWDTYFRMARGTTSREASNATSQDAAACEMTKWFDTNYHYIVPEFDTSTRFQLASSHPFDAFHEALELGVDTIPVLVGPVTYLKLGKARSADGAEFDRLSLLDSLLDIYEQVVAKFSVIGAKWIRFDEPVFALDLTDAERLALSKTYQRLKSVAGDVKLFVASYFGGLSGNLNTYCSLTVDALHLDLKRAPHELDQILPRIDENRKLSLGVVDGRNVWKTEYEKALPFIRKACSKIGEDRVVLSTSCSLLHSPVSLKSELSLSENLREWLSFSDEKLIELGELRSLVHENSDTAEILEHNRGIFQRREQHESVFNTSVRERVTRLHDDDFHRTESYEERQKAQRALGLPEFPTTTIGSFPQTAETRSIRRRFKQNSISESEYNDYLKGQIEHCVNLQEEIGLDVLVHGEFERNDMVEYFGEQLDGFAFTENGWVQSYGSRCVKPPLIYGDVSRPKPMTVDWSVYSQSLTKRKMKGMLTGPVTILQWSFERDDLSREQIAYQIALAIRDEVADLEAAGIAVIQIDEPAFREGLPLRKTDWDEYLDWSTKAFRLSSGNVKADTQIHTHMCYSEFNDIISSIAAMDADVITIETARSNMELLEAFSDFDYPNEIGPGVYDIHSPRVPTTGEMVKLMQLAAKRIPKERLWINPDCGLKTRDWPEVESSLKRMVNAAEMLRGN